jgi:hypothetical protein
MRHAVVEVNDQLIGSQLLFSLRFEVFTTVKIHFGRLLMCTSASE